MILYPHLDVNERGHLTIGGMDTVDLAKEYGTPLYLYDESVIRQNIRTYLAAAEKHLGREALPLFASKAFCCKEIYRIAAEEGIGIDCVSGGELFTARAAGFPAERIYFHGNNKTDADIRQALTMGVGTFVVDNREELEALDDILSKKIIRKLETQNPVYLRSAAEGLCQYLDELFGYDRMILCKNAIHRLERNA